MVSTRSFDESGDTPNWTTSCFKAAGTTDRVNTRLGGRSWRAVKRATCFIAFPLCSCFVAETFADSSSTSQDGEVTNGLRTHDNSCERCGDVAGVLTHLVGGVAHAFHDDRVVELRVQLGVEEVDGEGQERTG